MKKWLILIPALAGAAGAGIAAALHAKKSASAAKVEPKNKKAPVIKNTSKGIYSFVAGYKNAATVEVSVDYDADAFTFSVIEDEFLTYSSDSHVAVMYGEDFNLQIEYADYYSGDDFASLAVQLSEKYKGFEKIELSSDTAYKYISGDSVCYCLSAGESYVLVTVIPTKDSKETAETLQNNSQLLAILNSVKIA